MLKVAPLPVPPVAVRTTVTLGEVGTAVPVKVMVFIGPIEQYKLAPE
jgi:hypothetical protein